MRGHVLVLVLALAACSGDPAPRAAAPAPAPTTAAPSPTSGAPVPTAVPTTAAPTTAAPPTAALTGVRPLTPDQVPEAVLRSGADLAGTVAGLAFDDSAGSHVVVLREVEQTPGGKELFAVHLARAAPTAPWQVLREVRDGVQDCEFDVTAAFVPGVLAVRDEDGDGTGEVTFAYRTACRSDVSAADQKLLLLEGGDKYILRGRARSSYEADVPPVPEPAAASWPAGTAAASLARWQALPAEF